MLKSQIGVILSASLLLLPGALRAERPLDIADVVSIGCVGLRIEELGSDE